MSGRVGFKCVGFGSGSKQSGSSRVGLKLFTVGSVGLNFRLSYSPLLWRTRRRARRGLLLLLQARQREHGARVQARLHFAQNTLFQVVLVERVQFLH